jgi:predicted acetyltransferase
MDKLELIKPTKELEKEALAYKQEHINNGESELHGSSLLDKIDIYDDWLKLLKDNSNEKTVHSNWVVASTFFVVRKSDQKIIGMIDIRHTLNDLLRNYGGHIGYGVRPSERRKGYATQMLKMGLEYARQIGLTKVMLACYKDNLASRKTIEKCNGIFEKEVLHTDGKIVQIYWILL